MRLLLCLTVLLVSAVAECPFNDKADGGTGVNRYRKTYINEEYRFSVRLPGGAEGRDQLTPPHQGFAIDLGVRNGKRDSYIVVDGSHNFLEFKIPAEQAAQEIAYIGNDSIIESKTSQPTTVDSLPAVTVTATFRCKDSPQRYVVISTYVLSKDGDLAYTLALYAPEGAIEKYKPRYDTMIRSWKIWPTWRKTARN
jgi:hypothetical protein